MFKFTKMHALGNDFVVIDGIEQEISLSAETAAAIANRRTGIGCDQVLLVSRLPERKSKFGFHIFNNDGSVSAQCGNGARCLARYLFDHDYSVGKDIFLETTDGLLHCRIIDDTNVCVTLGVPQFEPSQVPFAADRKMSQYDIDVNGTTLKISALSLGNPHAVIQIEDTSRADVATIGPALEHHPRFPERTNVGFMEVTSRQEIRLRVHERGAGETQACGSGACAAVIAGRVLERLDEEVKVHMPGGQLSVSWAGAGHGVRLTGPTTYAFEGVLHNSGTVRN